MARVSIIVPTRDRLEKLQHALSGIRSQTYKDFELIVVVDGSSDGTTEWLKTHLAGARVVVMGMHGGAAAARNCGIAYASGEFIAFLDDDDFWRPSYLEMQVANLDRHPDAGLSYSDHLEIDAKGHESRPDTHPLLSYDNPVVGFMTECFIHTLSVVVCRRRLFDQFGCFDPKLSIVHDLDWYTRLLAAGTNFVRLPERLVERGIPGGLVSKYRNWFQEERALVNGILRTRPEHRKHERMICAYRELFFAGLGLAAGDLIFGFARLFEALLHSVHWTTKVAALRLWRRLQSLQGSSMHEYTR